MKTPFVAHMPNILVIHAGEALVAACKAAGPTLGMPVRVAPDLTVAADLVRALRPLVLVCDERSGIEDASVAAHLAGTIGAVVVQLRGDEAQDDVTAKLRGACSQAETKRT